VKRRLHAPGIADVQVCKKGIVLLFEGRGCSEDSGVKAEPVRVKAILGNTGYPEYRAIVAGPVAAGNTCGGESRHIHAVRSSRALSQLNRPSDSVMPPPLSVRS